MNLDPSNFPHIAAATRLAKPGFDILSALSAARQTALPTVRMLRARAARERHVERINALTHFLGAKAAESPRTTARPVRFFDLTEGVNVPPETMNGPFTRGFQPMLSPSPVAAWSSAMPIPHDEDDME